ncbi:MAG TPA: pyruvate kinase [Bacteroidales bacterium]|nr:pyruvate kinase [Bacteroidales bacterium]HNS45786.1 pyruvate kinase [Bacteroidales bacterium]
MKIKAQKIDELISRLDLIVKETTAFKKKYASELAAVHPNYKYSALNLVHYLALRNHDIRDLQKKLGYLGLSRMAKTEPHVMASLNHTRLMLNRLKGNLDDIPGKQAISIKKSIKLMRSNTRALFGNRPQGRRTRIMVTLPAEASTDYPLVLQLLQEGMNVARINCAHDTSEVWEGIIVNIHQAERETGKSCKIVMDLAGPKLRTGSIVAPPAAEHTPEQNDPHRACTPEETRAGIAAATPYILLKTDDTLVLHRDPAPGEPARTDDTGTVIQPAHISCTFPSIFERVKAGEPILFDDGKIAGTIQSVSDGEIILRITRAKPAGSKLRADRGINLPESDLSLSGLTGKDRQDLEFIAHYADMVNLSFVNDPSAVQRLLDALAGLHAEIGLIVKIETRKGYSNLPGILLTAMKTYPVGVMIARGDLAIECGWENMARIQQEILRICEAAHLPDIWATQVLENLAKKGLPSRAEITDAALSQQAECVMLNKGDHIFEAIRLLDTIIRDTENYQDKMAPLSPELKTSLK